MSKFVTAPWVSRRDALGDYWDAPDGTLSRVDLRTLANIDTPGLGFFELDDRADTPAGAAVLTTDIAVAADLLWDLLNGDTLTNPIMPDRDGNLKLRLKGHGVVRSEKFEPDSHPFVAEQVQADYETLKLTESIRTLQRVAGAWKQELGSDLRTEDQKLDGIRDPRSTVSDDFNRTEDLDAGNWTEIAGVWAAIATGGGQVNLSTDVVATATYDTPLSSSSNYAQMSVDDVASATIFITAWLGVMARALDGVATGYIAFYDGNGATSGNYANLYLQRMVSGSRTHIDLDSAGGTLPEVLKLDVFGSNQVVTIGGVDTLWATDTVISTGLHVGLLGRNENADTTTVIGSSFAGGDHAATNYPPMIVGNDNLADLVGGLTLFTLGGQGSEPAAGGYGNDVLAVPAANIATVNGVATANISKVLGA